MKKGAKLKQRIHHSGNHLNFESVTIFLSKYEYAIVKYPYQFYYNLSNLRVSWTKNLGPFAIRDHGYT